MSEHNTLFLRLEAPLQSWGLQGKLVFRDSAREPTKSGVVGLLACALGRKRWESVNDLAALEMGVRVDREGGLTRDYHTVGAKIGIQKADGKGVKYTAKSGELETLLSVRMYLADASFVVALHGDPKTIERCAEKVQSPVWPIYLGRKSCPPAVPVYVGTDRFDGESPEVLKQALKSVPWRQAFRGDRRKPDTPLRLMLEVPPNWEPSRETDKPSQTRGDHPLYFWPPEAKDNQFQQLPRHSARYVVEDRLPLDDISAESTLANSFVPKVRAFRRGYSTKGKLWGHLRLWRLECDQYLCQLTGLPAEEVHHKKYRNDIPEDILGDSLPRLPKWNHKDFSKIRNEVRPLLEVNKTLADHVGDDLISLSRLAHEAVTLLEYQHDMGTKRIDPLHPKWRPRVLQTIQDILTKRETAFRRRKKRSH